MSKGRHKSDESEHSCYDVPMRFSLRILLTASAVTMTACTQDIPSNTAQLSAEPIAQASSSSVPPPPKPALEQQFTSKKDGYSISYPAGWTVKENATSPLTYRKAAGLAIITPDDYAKGTTFLSGIAFIERTRKPCAQFVNPKEVTIDGRVFMKGDSTTVGSKNFQRTTMYTITEGNACFSLMLSVRGCNAGDNCGDQYLNSFDPTELSKTFDQMVASLKILYILLTYSRSIQRLDRVFDAFLHPNPCPPFPYRRERGEETH
jgi:hypothetical protein